MADNNMNSQVQSAINSIPFENIIGGPLVACVGAQRDASWTAYNYMRELTMQETGEDGRTEPVMVSFSFVKDGKKLRLNVPLLTIVPLPYIQIDYVDLAFTADITATKVENNVAKLTARYSTEGNEDKVVADEQTTTNSALSTQNLMTVNIRAVTSDVPPGLAKMQEIFGQHLVFDEVLLPEEPAEEEIQPEEPIIPEEPAKEMSIDERLQAMIDDPKSAPRFDLDGPACYTVEDIFTITGRGTVATGPFYTGKFNTADAVSIISSEKNLDSVITGIEVSRKLVDSIEAGPTALAGLLLRGVEKTDLSRGDIITHRDSGIQLNSKMIATVRLLRKEEGGRHNPIASSYRPQFYFYNTLDMTGMMTLPEGVEMMMPGETLDVTIELIKPYYLRENDGFVIREGGRTVGVGVIKQVISE